MNTKFDELLEFPASSFKVLGVADPALPDMVVEVLQQHAPAPTARPFNLAPRATITRYG
jgi:putative lipoic acid-binding regulatory protein